MVLASKESGKALPRFSDDDVIDFVVTEAITMKYLEHKAEQRKEAERQAKLDAWRKTPPGSGKPW